MVIEDSLQKPIADLVAAMQATIMWRSHYCGIQTRKAPTDFWVYQEIIWEFRPDAIIEIGNYNGGSTLALAHMLDRVGHGSVIGVDVDHTHVAEMARNHPRVMLVTGDAASVVGMVRESVLGLKTVMVIEDSSHTIDNTLKVLRTYSPLVTMGSYFVVEDSIIWHGVPGGAGDGPYEAIELFLKETDSFVPDRNRESFMLTWNPKGFLRRVK